FITVESADAAISTYSAELNLVKEGHPHIKSHVGHSGSKLNMLLSQRLSQPEHSSP
ncbi:hypothetical protein KI387_025534, partial [Taxus chinensis]